MMKKKTLSAIAASLLLPLTIVMGQGPSSMWRGPEDILGFLNSIMNWIWAASSIIVVIFLIYAGFLFVTAAGVDKQITQAKDMLKYALIGVVVMILAGSVMGVMTGFLAN